MSSPASGPPPQVPDDACEHREEHEQHPGRALRGARRRGLHHVRGCVTLRRTVAPVAPVGPVTAPVTPVDPPVGPVAVSPSGPVVGSGDGVSVGDGCSLGGGCSPSRSRMPMIARISRPCPGAGPSVGSAGDSLGGWVGSSVAVSTGPVGPVGAVGSPDSVGPVGAVGSPDPLAVGPVGRGLGSALGSPLTPLGSASRIWSRDSSVHAVASRPSITRRITTLRRPCLTCSSVPAPIDGRTPAAGS